MLIRPMEEDQRAPERLTQTYLEQVNVNQNFREVVEFFASVRYLHIVPNLCVKLTAPLVGGTARLVAISRNSLHAHPRKHATLGFAASLLLYE